MNAWHKVDREERVAELYSARSEALGRLLGVIDMIMLAEENPAIFSMPEKLTALLVDRLAYDVAAAAYLDARLAAK